MRTLIFGGPRTGKTTKADKLGAERAASMDPRSLALPPLVRHTDDLVGVLAWSVASLHIATDWLTQPGPWIIEGVAVGRALRKWLAANPDGKPCDEVLLLWAPVVDRNPGQVSMGKACATVWAEVEPELLARGVRVVKL